MSFTTTGANRQIRNYGNKIQHLNSYQKGCLELMRVVLENNEDDYEDDYIKTDLVAVVSHQTIL